MVPVEVLAPAAVIVGSLGVAGWVFTTWLRIRHGYPLENSWGKAVYPQKNEEMVERIKLMADVETVAVLKKVHYSGLSQVKGLQPGAETGVAVAKGAFAAVDGRFGEIKMDPDSDQEVKLRWLDDGSDLELVEFEVPVLHGPASSLKFMGGMYGRIH